jgi:hypothetical protein
MLKNRGCIKLSRGAETRRSNEGEVALLEPEENPLHQLFVSYLHMVYPIP